MGENYVELMWRVVKHGHLLAAFLDLADAKEFAAKVMGEVWVATTRQIDESK
jgi:hypothetical protein